MANWVSAGCGVIANELAQAMEKRGQKLYGVPSSRIPPPSMKNTRLATSLANPIS